MKIGMRIEEDVAILALDGKLVIGSGDVQLRDDVDDLLREGRSKMLINMKKVSKMDSSGLGELIRAKKEADRHEAVIKLVHVEDKARKILNMTRLIGIFETFDDEAQALASFRG